PISALRACAPFDRASQPASSASATHAAGTVRLLPLVKVSPRRAASSARSPRARMTWTRRWRSSRASTAMPIAVSRGQGPMGSPAWRWPSHMTTRTALASPARVATAPNSKRPNLSIPAPPCVGSAHHAPGQRGLQRLPQDGADSARQAPERVQQYQAVGDPADEALVLLPAGRAPLMRGHGPAEALLGPFPRRVRRCRFRAQLAVAL